MERYVEASAWGLSFVEGLEERGILSVNGQLTARKLAEYASAWREHGELPTHESTFMPAAGRII